MSLEDSGEDLGGSHQADTPPLANLYPENSLAERESQMVGSPRGRMNGARTLGTWLYRETLSKSLLCWGVGLRVPLCTVGK